MVIFESKIVEHLTIASDSTLQWFHYIWAIFSKLFWSWREQSFRHNDCSLTLHITQTILFWLIKNGSNLAKYYLKVFRAVRQFWFQQQQFKLHSMMYQKGFNNVFKNVLGTSGTVEWYFFSKNFSILVQGARLHWLW